MALLWMDGFDHYNGLNSNLERAYSVNSTTQFGLSSVSPRTGEYSLRTSTINARTVQFGIGGTRMALGVGMGWRISTLPVSTQRLFTITSADSSNRYVANVFLLTSGALRVTRSNSATTTQIGSDSESTVTLDAYTHVEIFAEIDDGMVNVELRMNGNTEITGSVSVGSGTGEATDVSTINLNFQHVGQCLDDLFVWDTLGSVNNTFLGPKRVITLFPSADTAVAGWSGDYEDIVSDDGDTSTITAGTSTPITSEFELDDLPSGVSGVAGVQTVFIARTDTEGAAEVQASILSGAGVAAGTTRLIDTSYDGYYDIHEVDPDTSSAWSVSAVNSSKLRLSRTS